MKVVNQRLWSIPLLLWSLVAQAGQGLPAKAIASLIDPTKLATLAKHGANSRVRRCVYWLVVARSEGSDPAKVMDAVLAGMKVNTLVAKLTKDALLRNLDIAEKLGCLLLTLAFAGDPAPPPSRLGPPPACSRGGS
jgi:hypothetical protein